MGQVRKDPPKTLRKKQVRHVDAPGRPWARLSVFILFLGVVGGIWLASSTPAFQKKWHETLVFVSKKTGFELRDVAVVGREKTSQKDLLAAIQCQQGDAMLLIEPSLVRENVKKLPWVYEASVRRQFPDTLIVEVQERQPLALWQNEGTHKLIDDQGQIVPIDDLGEYKKLLVVSGSDAPLQTPVLIRFLDQYPDLKALIQGAQYMRANRWDLYLDHDICVKLPENDVEKAMVRLVALHNDGQLSNNEILVVDLRDPEKLTVRMTPEAAQKYYKKGQDV